MKKRIKRLMKGMLAGMAIVCAFAFCKEEAKANTQDITSAPIFDNVYGYVYLNRDNGSDPVAWDNVPAVQYKVDSTGYKLVGNTKVVPTVPSTSVCIIKENDRVSFYIVDEKLRTLYLSARNGFQGDIYQAPTGCTPYNINTGKAVSADDLISYVKNDSDTELYNLAWVESGGVIEEVHTYHLEGLKDKYEINQNINDYPVLSGVSVVDDKNTVCEGIEVYVMTNATGVSEDIKVQTDNTMINQHMDREYTTDVVVTRKVEFFETSKEVVSLEYSGNPVTEEQVLSNRIITVEKPYKVIDVCKLDNAVYKKGSEILEANPVLPGDYSITVTFDEKKYFIGTRTYNFTIKKGNFPEITVKIDDWYEGETPKEPYFVSTSDLENIENYRELLNSHDPFVFSKASGDGAFESLDSIPTVAGSYKVECRIDDPNGIYNEGTSSCEFKILPKKVAPPRTDNNDNGSKDSTPSEPAKTPQENVSAPAAGQKTTAAPVSVAKTSAKATATVEKEASESNKAKEEENAAPVEQEEVEEKEEEISVTEVVSDETKDNKSDSTEGTIVSADNKGAIAEIKEKKTNPVMLAVICVSGAAILGGCAFALFKKPNA